MGGKIDVLINNAGTGVSSPLEKINKDDFLHVFNVNVFGLALLTKEIVPKMKVRNLEQLLTLVQQLVLKDIEMEVYMLLQNLQ